MQQQPQDAAQEEPPEEPAAEPAIQQKEAAESPEASPPEAEPEPAQPAPAKAPRMLSRLSSDLDGSNWRNPNFNVEPLRSRRRFITAQITFWNDDEQEEGSPYNTEPVPDDEPHMDQGGPEAPGQTNPSSPEQQEP